MATLRRRDGGELMRILQAMAGADYGGAEAFFSRLVLGLHRAGIDQRVVIRRNPRRAEGLRAGGVEPVELAFGGLLDLRTPRDLRHQIREFTPDIVLTWMNRATRMCPKSKGDFVHVARLGGYYDLKYYRDCDHLIGNTRDIVEYLTDEGWPGDKAHYLPNFVSAERVPPVSRPALYTPDRVRVLLALGRLHENKGFDVLLEALARVPDAYLWLAGDGPLRGPLEKQAEHLAIKPRVRFLGWREDTAALFAACDAFICPSRHEPLGNVVIEAWAQGIPVIATDSLGPGTLITHMENGLLTPVDDSQTLARAIRFLFEDDDRRVRIAQAGHAAYEKDFTERAVIDRYLGFFEEVLRPPAEVPEETMAETSNKIRDET
jgi:glycosyltransferase involved in cell wall biosynthesis